MLGVAALSLVLACPPGLLISSIAVHLCMLWLLDPELLWHATVLLQQ